jgi:hypothetical protein
VAAALVLAAGLTGMREVMQNQTSNSTLVLLNLFCLLCLVLTLYKYSNEIKTTHNG